ncbi:MAG: ABC transporter ATP-binding protein [Nitrospiraceae bacterium]
MTQTPLLSLSDLKSYYDSAAGTIRAVDGVSLDLYAGEILGIVGESGSGKSTLSLSLLGLLDPPGRIAGGELWFQGEDLLALDESGWQNIRGKKIGMIFQSPEGSFNPISTIGQQIAEALQAHRTLSRREAEAEAEMALALVRMPQPREIFERYPFELSLGMCQRASLALALSLHPAVLIADEPTASLDIVSQAAMASLFLELQATHNLSLIIISHDLGLVRTIADRVVVMHAGKIVEEGPSDQVLEAPRHPYTQGLVSSELRLDR